MSDAFIQSLQITALGMGLVFGAIILLWWMMVLLTSFTADKKTPAPMKTPHLTRPSLLLFLRQDSKPKPPRSLWQLRLQNKDNPPRTRCLSRPQQLSLPGSWACGQDNCIKKGIQKTSSTQSAQE